MNYDSYLRYLVSLVFVIGLIGVFAWALRRFGPAGRLKLAGQRRLAVIEILALDARRRLVLLRRDDQEHLILLGPARDLVIETGIVPPRETRPSAFASHLPEPPR